MADQELRRSGEDDRWGVTLPSRIVQAADRLNRYFYSMEYAGDWDRALCAELMTVLPTAAVVIHMEELGEESTYHSYAGGWPPLFAWPKGCSLRDDPPAAPEHYSTLNAVELRTQEKPDFQRLCLEPLEGGRHWSWNVALRFPLDPCWSCPERQDGAGCQHHQVSPPVWVDWFVKGLPALGNEKGLLPVEGLPDPETRRIAVAESEAVLAWLPVVMFVGVGGDAVGTGESRSLESELSCRAFVDLIEELRKENGDANQRRGHLLKFLVMKADNDLRNHDQALLKKLLVVPHFRSELQGLARLQPLRVRLRGWLDRKSRERVEEHTWELIDGPDEDFGAIMGDTMRLCPEVLLALADSALEVWHEDPHTIDRDEKAGALRYLCAVLYRVCVAPVLANSFSEAMVYGRFSGRYGGACTLNPGGEDLRAQATQVRSSGGSDEQ